MVQNVRFLVPDLWADHHVIKVRKVLLGAPGVTHIYASAAFKEVAVDYDGAITNADQLASLLSAAGYPPVSSLSSDGHEVVYGEADSMWRNRGSRVTTTNQRDIEMSGDFRRY